MSSPKPFIAIIDCNRDVRELMGRNSSSMTIFSTVKMLNSRFPGGAPHIPMLWTGSSWYEFKNTGNR
jgi:hypothetical protein